MTTSTNQETINLAFQQAMQRLGLPEDKLSIEQAVISHMALSVVLAANAGFHNVAEIRQVIAEQEGSLHLLTDEEIRVVVHTFREFTQA